MIVVSSEPGEDDETQKITIHVSDTGCGIAQNKLDRIFESFSQEDGSTTRKFGGTGLGLSITRKLARMMGGDVTVVSQQGRGSVFTLTFSAQDVSAPYSEQTTKTVRIREPRPRTSLSGCRALVVDDNAINLRVAKSFLEHYDVEVTLAGDGNEALDKLSHQPFDIVLMDIHMPGLDGAEAFRRLRMSASPNRLIPVLALTADSMAGDRERYLSMGFDGYVSKPIDERSLVTAMGQVLSIQTSDERLQAAI